MSTKITNLPMNRYLSRAFARNRDLILEKSFLNCHAKGVHSFVLEEKPDGALVRMYYATPEHNLWRNHSEASHPSRTVAIHDHHCALTLSPLMGEPMNFVYTPQTPIEGSPMVKEWVYESPISGGPGLGSFKETGGSRCLRRTHTSIIGFSRGGEVHLKADILHSMSVAHGQTAAWLVTEDLSNRRTSQGYCYSNNDLSRFDWTGLYQRTTEQDLDRVAVELGLRVRNAK